MSFATRPFPGLPDLPADEYGLIELYCTDPSCDCRRVLFLVARLSDDTVVAALNYGWEPPAFYKRWSPHDPSASALSGVTVDPTHPQTPLSKPLQLVVQALVTEDNAYRSMLQRHYDLFRAAPRPAKSHPVRNPGPA